MRMRDVKRGLAAAGMAMAIVATPALAQLSLEDIEARLGESTAELERVDAILADADANRRIAGMQLLLASGNPVFVQRAKEAGLLSSDPAMQAAALKAVFDAAGAFRIDFDLSGLDKDSAEAWAEFLRGNGNLAADGRTGSFIINIGAFNADSNCYPGDHYNRGDCAFRLSGKSVQMPLAPLRIEGVLDLDGAGGLAGTLTAQRIAQAVPVTLGLLD